VRRIVSQRGLVLILAAVIATACVQDGPAPTAPVITAQGFVISEPRTALVSEFDDVRVRLEVSGKIEEILIKQGSFGADLAKTLDKDLFRLFGLDQRPYSRSDVTLNFRNYINEEIIEAGTYRIDIAVTDHLGQSASKTLLLEARAASEPDTAAAPEVAEIWAESGEFVFRRVGPGGLTGADPFGITWKTIDPIKVTIRVAGAVNGANKIARLDAVDFQAVHTRSQVAEIVDRCVSEDVIEFDTANAAAAGQVLAVVNDEQRYILQAFASETTLSEAGTTVVVTGRYKY